MKGIVLAGGSGTRLHPLTTVVSKQMLPVYDKPLIFYPLSVLLLAGIREILVITTPQDQPMFRGLLRDGEQFGVEIKYAIQPRPEGLAQAFIIGRDFVGTDSCVLILGDNIFYGDGLAELLSNAQSRKIGATIFAYQVLSPQRYGVITFDDAGKATSIEEKPQLPTSNWAVTGLYFYDNDVLRYAAEVKPSDRGELEITDVNQRYLKSGGLNVECMGRGYAWLDAGTPDSLLEASEFVATIERRQGLKICCPEEIALNAGLISKSRLEAHLMQLGKGAYAEYLRHLVRRR